MRYLLLGVVLSLLGCGHPQINVHVTADQLLNRDANGRALPVQLRIYQLIDNHAFKQAAFWQLWQHGHNLLANSAITSQQLTIIPGDQQTVHLLRDKRAKYLGVMALFRNPDPHAWQQVVSLLAPFPFINNSVSLHLRGNKIDPIT